MNRYFQTLSEAEDYFYKQGALNPEYIGLFKDFVYYRWVVLFEPPQDLEYTVIQVMGNI